MCRRIKYLIIALMLSCVFCTAAYAANAQTAADQTALNEQNEISIETGVVRWKKVQDAARYEYIIVYTDKDGESQSSSGNTKANSLPLARYIKKTDDKNANRADGLTGFAVRCVFEDGSQAAGAGSAYSKWTVYGTVELPGDDEAKLKEPSRSVNSSSPTGTGWMSSEKGQSYIDPQGIQVRGWATIEGLWYRFDTESGIMLTGWLDIDGNRYYFNTEADAAKNSMHVGVMLTGWQEIDGVKYYFNDNEKNGVYGALTEQK